MRAAQRATRLFSSVAVGLAVGALGPTSAVAAPAEVAAGVPAPQVIVPDDARPERQQFGADIDVDGDTMVVGASQDDVVATASGSVYVFVRSGGAWVQQAKIAPSDGAMQDYFGKSVAVSGDTIAVGSWNEAPELEQSGSVYVFVRTGSTWSQQANLRAPSPVSHDDFGHAIDLVGDTLVVAADGRDIGDVPGAGALYVLVRSGSTWTRQAQLTAPGAEDYDGLGASVALDGDTVIAGTYDTRTAVGRGAGAAFVFVRSGTAWQLQAQLTPSDGAKNAHFGAAVDIDGDTAVVGEASQWQGRQGRAFVFERSGALWTEQKRLLPANGEPGDRFGTAVAVRGNAIAVGAHGSDLIGPTGAAYLFAFEKNVWRKKAKFYSPHEDSGSFGAGVHLDGTTLVVSAMFDDSGTVFAYQR